MTCITRPASALSTPRKVAVGGAVSAPAPRFQAHVFSLPETGRCGAVIHEGRGLPSGAGRPILRGCHLQVDATNVPSKDDSIALSTWRLLSHAVSDETSGSRNHLPTCVSPSLLRVFLGPLRCDVGFRVGGSDAKPPREWRWPRTSRRKIQTHTRNARLLQARRLALGKVGLLPSSWLVSSDNDNDRSRATTSGAGRRDVRQQRQCVRQPRGDGQAAVTLCPPPCQRGHAIHAPAERAPTRPVEEAGRSRPATPSRLTGPPVPPLQLMLRDEPGPELHVLPGSSRLPSPTGTLDHTLDSKESISAPNLYGAFIEKSEPVPLPRKQLLG